MPIPPAGARQLAAGWWFVVSDAAIGVGTLALIVGIAFVLRGLGTMMAAWALRVLSHLPARLRELMGTLPGVSSLKSMAAGGAPTRSAR